MLDDTYIPRRASAARSPLGDSCHPLTVRYVIRAEWCRLRCREGPQWLTYLQGGVKADDGRAVVAIHQACTGQVYSTQHQCSVLLVTGTKYLRHSYVQVTAAVLTVLESSTFRAWLLYSSVCLDGTIRR